MVDRFAFICKDCASSDTRLSTPARENARAGDPGFPPQRAKTARAGDPGFPPQHAKTARAGDPGFGAILELASVALPLVETWLFGPLWLNHY